MFDELNKLLSMDEELSSGKTVGDMILKGIKAARDVLQTLALYITIALIVGIVIYAVIVRNRDEEYFAKARKVITGLIVGYAAGVIAILGSLRVMCYALSGDINSNFWLFIGLIALAAAGITVTLILKKNNVSGAKWCGLAFAIAFAVYAIVIACVVPPLDEDFKPLSQGIPGWTMYLFSAILVAVIVAAAVFGGRNDKSEYDSKSLTYAAICIALSFALSYIKFFSLPQGGSVTFASLLPLALYAYMFGTRKGLIAGVVYGLLQFIQSPQFYEPMQALLDYPIAFGAIGLAGIARNFKFLKGNIFAEFAVGTTIAVLLRYFAHVISGYFVFSSWAMEGFTAVSWAFVYNLFTIADLAIVLAVGLLALSSKAVRSALRAATVSADSAE